MNLNKASHIDILKYMSNIRNIIMWLIILYLSFSVFGCAMITQKHNDIKNENSIKDEVNVSFIRYYGEYKTTISLNFHTKEPHEKMFVEELSMEIDGKKIIISKNKKIRFKYSVGVMNGLWVEIKRIDVNKYFRDMNIGDEKTIKVILKYYFDDDNTKSKEMYYRVICSELLGIHVFEEILGIMLGA